MRGSGSGYTIELWSGACATVLALVSAASAGAFAARSGEGALLPLALLLALPGTLAGIGAYVHVVRHQARGIALLSLGTGLLAVLVVVSGVLLALAFGTGFLRFGSVARTYPSPASFLLNTWYLWLWLAQALALAAAGVALRVASTRRV